MNPSTYLSIQLVLSQLLLSIQLVHGLPPSWIGAHEVARWPVPMAGGPEDARRTRKSVYPLFMGTEER